MIATSLLPFAFAQTPPMHIVIDGMPKQGGWDVTAIANFGLGLVLVGLVTFAAVYYQAKETARSARAAEGSTQIQKAQMKQWLESDAWRLDDSDFKNVEQTYLRVTCDIVNPTTYPLTLNSVESQIRTAKTTSDIRTQLPPGARYLVSAQMEPKGREDTDSFVKDQLVFSVHIRVNFTDVLGENQSQVFRKYCRCGSNILATFDRFDGLPDESSTLPRR